MTSHDSVASQAWYVTKQWQRYDGELRANRVRVAAIVPFYCIHLLQQVFGPAETGNSASQFFHIGVTVLVVAWLSMSLAVEMSLRHRFFPKSLGMATTFFDVAVVTAMMSLGGGQSSPLVLAYPLIIGLSSLRMSLGLVRWTTLAAIVGYGALLVIGRGTISLPTGPIGVVPRYAQAMTIMAIMVAGFVAGQLIGRINVVAEFYARRLLEQSRTLPSIEVASSPPRPS